MKLQIWYHPSGFEGQPVRHPLITPVNRSEVQFKPWPKATYLFIFSKPGFVVNVRCDQIKSVLLRQDSQKQDHSATPTLANPVVHHLAGEGQRLGRNERARKRLRGSNTQNSSLSFRTINVSSTYTRRIRMNLMREQKRRIRIYLHSVTLRKAGLVISPSTLIPKTVRFHATYKIAHGTCFS